MSDSGERTEAATDKRMKEVREKGQLSRSQDLTAWLAVGTVALMVPMTVSLGSTAATDQMLTVGAIIQNPDPDAALKALSDGFGSMAATLGPMLGAVSTVVLVGSIAQGGVHPKKFAGKFDQFDLVKGVGRLFGGQAWWGGFKALLKTAVLGMSLYFVVQGLLPVILNGGGLSISAVLTAAGSGAASLLQTAVIAGLVLAAADALVVQKRNRKKTRMTKKEVKDESKSSDGDPMVKSQRRSRQLAMSRNRMMSAVATADVVMVNPTHIAVALKYEPGKSAPRVVAKGSGEIAARIRARAEAEGVPIVRDIPLARALHSMCDLGQEIPADLYGAVAAVLAFVMALRRRGSAAGTHTMSTSPFVTSGGH